MDTDAAGPAALRPWSDRRFVIFATGNFVNNLGEAAWKVGLPLFVYNLTGSLAAMSVIAAVAPLALLAGPWLGAVVDRWGSRVFVVPGLLLQLVSAASLNVMAMAIARPPLVAIFALACGVQLGGELYRSGWIAGVPALFPRNAAQSRSVLSSLFVASNVVGPALTALGISTIGYIGVLWFNVATFVAPIVVWLLGVHPPRGARKEGPSHSITSEIADGWRIIKAEPRVVYIQFMTVPLDFVSGTGVLTFFVFYLRNHAGVSGSSVGLIQALANAGALLGSAFIAVRVRYRPHAVLLVSAVVMTLSLLALGFSPLLLFVVELVCFYTVRSAMTNVTAWSLVNYLPGHVMGRAEGMFNLIGGVPLLASPFVITAVHSGFGDQAVLLMLSAVAATSVIYFFTVRRAWTSSDVAAAEPPVTS